MSNSNAGPKGSADEKRKKGQLIQFSAYSTELSQQLKRDVKVSRYRTKTKYLNALIGKVLSIERRFDSRSQLDELFRILDLVGALPIEHIQELAPTQHRNFDQMLMHLLQTALSDYPDLTSLNQGVSRQQAAPKNGAVSKQAFDNN